MRSRVGGRPRVRRGDTQAQRKRAAETTFQPWCGRCDLLNDYDAKECAGCGCRLYPANCYPERR